MRAGLVLVGVVVATGPVLAQSTTIESLTGQVPSSTAGNFGAAANGTASIKKLLVDGYEVKAGFADTTGGAYMLLQKTTSAYLCHSNPNPICEKLN